MINAHVLDCFLNRAIKIIKEEINKQLSLE